MSPPNENTNDLVTLAYRVGIVEKDLQEIKLQIGQLATTRENDLRFRSLQDKVDAAIDDIREVKDNVKGINTKNDQERKDIAEEMKQIRQTLSSIQISGLVTIVGFFLTIVGGVVVILLTHNITP